MPTQPHALHQHRCINAIGIAQKAAVDPRCDQRQEHDLEIGAVTGVVPASVNSARAHYSVRCTFSSGSSRTISTSEQGICAALDRGVRVSSARHRPILASNGSLYLERRCRCCSGPPQQMRHLVRVCLNEGRPRRGARDIVATGSRSKPIDWAQHIRHEDVGDGEGPSQPFASCQHWLQVLESGPE